MHHQKLYLISVARHLSKANSVVHRVHHIPAVLAPAHASLGGFASLHDRAAARTNAGVKLAARAMDNVPATGAAGVGDFVVHFLALVSPRIPVYGFHR